MRKLLGLSKKLTLCVIGIVFYSCSQDEKLITDPQADTELSFTNKQINGKINLFKGPENRLGNGKVRSWISINKETEMPEEIGIIMTPEAMKGLSTEDGHHINPIYPELHSKAKEITPFNHIGINWGGQGHGAPPMYGTTFNVPHFDIHFYLISFEEREAIADWNFATPNAVSNGMFNLFPLPCFMPRNYFVSPVSIMPSGGAIGKVGKHWLPLRSPPPPSPAPAMTHTMVYGSYNGKFSFVEPMITYSFLESKIDFSGPFSQPLKFEKAGNYPTKYNVYHDNKTGNIYITLSDFVAREASVACN